MLVLKPFRHRSGKSCEYAHILSSVVFKRLIVVLSTMNKLKEINEREKIARIKLAILQKQHARAIKKLQKAEKTKQQDCRRRKTIHGYPTSLSSSVNDAGGSLATISEENLAPEQLAHLGGSQPSNLQTLRLGGCNSTDKSFPKESQGNSCKEAKQNTDTECQHVPETNLSDVPRLAQYKTKTKTKDHSQTLDGITSSYSKIDCAEGKDDVVSCKIVEMTNSPTRMTSHNSTRNLNYNVDGCMHLSTKSSILTDNHSEDLLPVSMSSDKDSIAKYSSDLNVDENEGRIVTKLREFGQDHTMVIDGENSCVQDCKGSVMISSDRSETPELPKVIEKKHNEMEEQKAVTNKHWLHLFEEPFPRRSPRVRKRPNYTENSHSQSFTESQGPCFSDKSFLESNPTKSKKHHGPFNNNVTNSVEHSDNSEYSAVCSSNSVNLSQHEYLDTVQKKLVNKPECDSESEQLGLSKNSRAFHYNSKEKSGKKRSIQKGKPPVTCKSRKLLESKETENSASLDLLKRSDSDTCNAGKFSFPKPSQDLTKPGGPLSIIVDFSLPDKEFAKLKLQKIKNSNLKVKGDSSKSSPCDPGTCSLPQEMIESLCSAEDEELSDKRVTLKPKSKKVSDLPAPNLDKVSTEFKPLMEMDTESHESTEIDQRQSLTEPTVKQHTGSSQRYILGKQERNYLDVRKVFEESLTFPSAEGSYASSSSHKCGSIDNMGNKPSDQAALSKVAVKASHLEEAGLINQNTCLQTEVKMDLGADQNVENRFYMCRTGRPVQWLETFQHSNHLEQNAADVSDLSNLPSSSDPLTYESPAKEASASVLFSTCNSQLETPYVCVRTPESPKLNSLNPQEPCVGLEATPFGKGDIPEDSSSAAVFSPEVAESDERSGTVPVLMQTCLQYSFPECNNEVRSLSISSYELPAASGEELRRKRDVIAVCLAHMIVVWGAQLGQQWQVLHTWKVDVSEEFLETQFVPFKSNLVLISGGNFTKGNSRVYCCSEDGECTLELKQEKLDTPSLFNAMCQLGCQSLITEQEGFALVVASCTASSQPLVTKWTLDSLCLTVEDEEAMPVTSEVRRILSLCAVDGSDTVLLGTTHTSLLIWNVKKAVLIKKISFQDIDLPTPCCLKALSYKGLLLLTMASGLDQYGKTVTDSDGKNRAATTSRCHLLAVNPVTTKMAALLHFKVASDVNSSQGVVGTNGHYIAVGHDDGYVRLWNLAWPSCSIELPVFHDRASSICFHPYRPVTAFGSTSGCVHLYSLG